MEWKLTSKELPKPDESVIVTVMHQYKWTAFAKINVDGTWRYADNEEKMPTEYKVTAWQPRPEPDKEDINA